MGVLKRAGHHNKLIIATSPPMGLLLTTLPFSLGALGSTTDDTAIVFPPGDSKMCFDHFPGWFCRNSLFDPNPIIYTWRMGGRRQNIPRGQQPTAEFYSNAKLTEGLGWWCRKTEADVRRGFRLLWSNHNLRSATRRRLSIVV